MRNSFKPRSITRVNALLIIIGTVSACILLLSIVLHTDVVRIEHDFEEFATHHYFLTGFISLVTVLLCLKFYNNTPENIYSFNILKQQTRRKRLIKKMERLQAYKKQLGLKIDTVTSRLIEKENVGVFSFSKDDLLISIDEIKQREIDLGTALKLGNNYQHKVKIYFKDIESNKHIETTVWQFDNTSLSIKGGVALPIRSIYKIEI